MRIGILADIQYSDENNHQKCQYRESLEKLAVAVETFNDEGVDFVVQLGDLINRDFESFTPVVKLLKALEMPIYHVLGNHDFVVDSCQKGAVPGLLGMASKYYAFEREDWYFLFLDGNDLSLNSYPENSFAHNESKRYFESNKSQSEWWNGAVGESQKLWLEKHLAIARDKGLKTGVFCHFPIVPASRFSLWNRTELYQIIKKYENVRFWMNGHHHEGAYEFRKGIHFVTFKGMVENSANAFAVLEIGEGELVIDGRGAESHRVLSI